MLLNSILDTSIHHGLREDPILRGIRHGLVGKRAQKKRLAACTGKPQVLNLDPEALGPGTMGIPEFISGLISPLLLLLTLSMTF